MDSGFYLNNIRSPILLQGSETTGYRDPTAVYEAGLFRLYFTLVQTEPDGQVYMYTAMSESKDLLYWSKPERLTARDQQLNFSSPGNIIKNHDRWVMCLQTYPRPKGEKYGNDTSRLWTMESDDLVHWESPQLLKVKGEQVDTGQMGRMIDPYLVESAEEPGLWWCFYKQNGVSSSYSRDLVHWKYAGRANAGENVCIIREEHEYVMFHSPENGIGMMRSTDLQMWREEEKLLTLGQEHWRWAQGRLTAGFVLDCREVEGVRKYLLFFHGTGPESEETIFDTHACIGMAWSDDLVNWEWPRI
ncbi:hypothetical protein [Paenibacillus luteus]|uniref:hypothetical protein n=1 Tax=Paenibacillus luteus TaxID=2545753 RepID=UPI0011426C50|nr:hypothetical protein [Paenibacillus luteus]